MKPAYIRDFDLLVIGEIFIELRCDSDIAMAEKYQKAVGGSDIVTAVAAARLGSAVSLVSAIACDPFHSLLRESLITQGINIDHTITCQGYNGIYLTSPRHGEEREYLFHRPGSAAQSITPALIYDDLIENSKIVYASSELQAVSKAARHTVFKAFNIAHINDIMVAYDPNLRLRLWSLDDAKECLWSVLPLVDVMLPSSPDESKALFGYERPLDVIGFLWDRGVSIVAVKNGDKGCLVGYNGKVEEIPLPEGRGNVTDVTLIGSAFNGGFLHSIACGFDPFTAARFANSVALYKGIKGGTVASLPAKADLV
jgi:2-dehydro-3-deoxygluconokinase